MSTLTCSRWPGPIRADVSRKIGYDNVEFRRGRIQDLAIDLEQLATELESVSLSGSEGALNLVRLQEDIRANRPMIADGSVDCIVSNCVLNLVKSSDRRQLFQEIFRVLKPGGRAAISDIVSSEDVPLELRSDATLWSGCISGAWREDRFVDEFVDGRIRRCPYRQTAAGTMENRERHRIPLGHNSRVQTCRRIRLLAGPTA